MHWLASGELGSGLYEKSHPLLLANEMILNVDMFSAIMMTGILREINSTAIVKENNGLV